MKISKKIDQIAKGKHSNENLTDALLKLREEEDA